MHDAKSCAEQIGKELIEGTYVSMIYSAHNMHLSSSQEWTKEPMKRAKEAKKNKFLSEQTLSKVKILKYFNFIFEMMKWSPPECGFKM